MVLLEVKLSFVISPPLEHQLSQMYSRRPSQDRHLTWLLPSRWWFFKLYVYLKGKFTLKFIFDMF